MLTVADQTTRNYIIALNEVTSSAELAADLSYLADAPQGQLVFDFTHTAPNLTHAVASEHIPGYFGFHALDRIIEQLTVISLLAEMPLLTCCSHSISVILPPISSKIGQFFLELGVFELMDRWAIPVETRGVWEPEGARDDTSRRMLIPLTDILVNGKGLPNAIQMTEIRDKISNGLLEDFDIIAPTQLAATVADIIEGISSLVRGGLLASLFFPTTGYLELSMMNRTEGAIGGLEPDDQLDALVSELETNSPMVDRVLDRVRRHYGTMQLFNGFASLLISPDGSFTAVVERIGLPSAGIPGPRVNVVLQLPPKSSILWESFAYERVANMWSTILN